MFLHPLTEGLSLTVAKWICEACANHQVDPQDADMAEEIIEKYKNI